MTRTNSLAVLGIVLAASVAACSYLVDADRTKVSDNLYQPTAKEAGPSEDASMGEGGPEDGSAGDGTTGDGGMTDGTAGETGGDSASSGDANGDAAADATGGG
jgi:hypothetical protein